ncbi:MAG: hypothetical protein ACFFAI_12770 [Promethearchaeota archaeon]
MSVILDRIVFHGYTSIEPVYIGQFRGFLIENLFIIIISLLIWFGLGFSLAYWVKKDIKKSNLETSPWVFIIIFTSVIGFIIYIMARYGETELLEKDENFSKFDEFIKEEKEEEFNDKIEEITEDDIEDVIEHILEEPLRI